MSWIEAIILGIIQGLTEFLPVSSSGHLEIGKLMLGVNVEESLMFTVAVHGATVLSTIVVFWKDIVHLVKTFFKFEWNNEMKYIIKILISMIPVLIVGIFFKDSVESLFTGNLFLVGSMLILTAILLIIPQYISTKNKEIPFGHAFIIGIAQAIAVIPGISRSGATIATGLALGNKKEMMARFSFLMVLIPIIGANLLEIKEGIEMAESGINISPILFGFIAAFLSGWLACRWMINIVKKGKLSYFAIYCAIIGAIAISYHFIF